MFKQLMSAAQDGCCEHFPPSVSVDWTGLKPRPCCAMEAATRDNPRAPGSNGSGPRRALQVVGSMEPGRGPRGSQASWAGGRGRRHQDTVQTAAILGNAENCSELALQPGAERQELQQTSAQLHLGGNCPSAYITVFILHTATP